MCAKLFLSQANCPPRIIFVANEIRLKLGLMWNKDLLTTRAQGTTISPQSTQDMPIQDSLFIITKQSKQFHEPRGPWLGAGFR